MIKNERQYRITKAEAEKFELHLGQMEVRLASMAPSSMERVLRQAELDGVRSQLADLQTELREYEDLRSGRRAMLESWSLDELPRSLVRARIAAGLSHKDLAERLGLKEQQVQRYEATDYAGASVSRLLEVASALGLRIKEDVFLPRTGSGFDVFGRLKEMGIEKDFVLNRLVGRPLAERAKDQAGTDHEVAFYVTAAVSHVYGWTPSAIWSNEPLLVSPAASAAARLKVPVKAEQKRLSAYTFYAHFLALHVLETTADVPTRTIPTDYQTARAEILNAYGAITFENVLRYVWDLGVPVLPLNDRGAFHGATWRVGGRNVIVLKQQTMSVARWLHDLLHELFHAGQEPALRERSVIEAAETSQERRESDEEWAATQYAADVVLDGRAEELATLCVDATKSRGGGSGAVERLKSAVVKVATAQRVPVDTLANYMAFRLSLQNVDWWGAAQNLQRMDANPWVIARDVLLERVQLGRVNRIDRDLLMQALTEPEV